MIIFCIRIHSIKYLRMKKHLKLKEILRLLLSVFGVFFFSKATIESIYLIQPALECRDFVQNLNLYQFVVKHIKQRKKKHNPVIVEKIPYRRYWLFRCVEKITSHIDVINFCVTF